MPAIFWNETWLHAVLMSGFGRMMVGLNCAWSVNSAAHIWGNKPYDTRINPAENLMVSLLAMGEGWHNYHHVFPWDYKAAESGFYPFNLTTFWIDVAASLNLVTERKQPSADLIKRTALKHGDGTHLNGHCHAEFEVPESEDVQKKVI